MSKALEKNWAIEVNWWEEECDVFYRNLGYPKKVWKDNEGRPFGIYGYDDRELEDHIDTTWYKTEEERDKKYKEVERELNGEIFWEYEFEQEREGMCHCNVGMTPKQLEDELHGQVQSDPEYRDPNREMPSWDEEFDL